MLYRYKYNPKNMESSAEYVMSNITNLYYVYQSRIIKNDFLTNFFQQFKNFEQS